MNSALDAGIPPQHEFAVEEHWATLDLPQGSARMRYLRAGTGPALVLVHGLLGVIQESIDAPLDTFARHCVFA